MRKNSIQRIAALALAAVLTITSFTSVPALEAEAAEPDAAGTITEAVTDDTAVGDTAAEETLKAAEEPEEETVGDVCTITFDTDAIPEGYQSCFGWLWATNTIEYTAGNTYEANTDASFTIKSPSNKRVLSMEVKINGGETQTLSYSTKFVKTVEEDGVVHAVSAFPYQVNAGDVIEVVKIASEGYPITINLSEHTHIGTHSDYAIVGQNYSLPLSHDEGYDMKVTYTVGDGEETVLSGTAGYEIPASAITDDITVNVSETPVQRSVTVTALDGAYVTYVDAQGDTQTLTAGTPTKILTYGTDFEFTVVNTEEETQSVSVSAAHTAAMSESVNITDKDDGKYSIAGNSLAYDITLTLTAGEPQKVMKLYQAEGETSHVDLFADKNTLVSTGKVKFSTSSDLKFYMLPNDGYNITGVNVYTNYGKTGQKALTVSESTATNEDDITLLAYTVTKSQLANLTGNLTLVVETEYVGCQVTISASHVTVTPYLENYPDTVEVKEANTSWQATPGTAVQFTVTPEEGYVISGVYGVAPDMDGELSSIALTQSTVTIDGEEVTLYTVPSGRVGSELKITVNWKKNITLQVPSYVSVSAKYKNSTVSLSSTTGNGITSYVIPVTNTQKDYKLTFSLTSDAYRYGLACYSIDTKLQVKSGDTYKTFGKLESDNTITLKYADQLTVGDLKLDAPAIKQIVYADGNLNPADGKTFTVKQNRYTGSLLWYFNGTTYEAATLWKGATDSHYSVDEDGYGKLTFTAADAGKTIKLNLNEDGKKVTVSFKVAKVATKLQFTGLTKSGKNYVQQVGTKATYGLKITPTDVDLTGLSVDACEMNEDGTEGDYEELTLSDSHTFTLTMGTEPIKVVAYVPTDIASGKGIEISTVIYPASSTVEAATPTITLVRATDTQQVVTLGLPKAMLSLYQALDGSTLEYEYSVYDAAGALLDLDKATDGIQATNTVTVTGATQQVTLDTSLYEGTTAGAAKYTLKVWLVQKDTSEEANLLAKSADKKIASKDFNTKAAAYETSLSLTQKTKKIYQGQQNILLATAKYSKATTYYGITADVISGPDEENLEVSTDANGQVFVSADQLADSGTYTIRVSSVTPDDEVLGSYKDITLTVQNKISFITSYRANRYYINYGLDCPYDYMTLDKSFVYVGTGKAATVKATMNYNSGAATKKVTYSVDEDAAAKGVTVNSSGKVTIPKDYEVTDEYGDMIYVYATAADYAENAQDYPMTSYVEGAGDTYESFYVYEMEDTAIIEGIYAGWYGDTKLTEGATVSASALSGSYLGYKFEGGDYPDYLTSEEKVTAKNVTLEEYYGYWYVTSAKAGKCSITIAANDIHASYTVNFYVAATEEPAILTLSWMDYGDNTETQYLVNADNQDETTLTNDAPAGTEFLARVKSADTGVTSATVSITGAKIVSTYDDGYTYFIPNAAVTKVTVKDPVGGNRVYTMTNTAYANVGSKVNISAKSKAYANKVSTDTEWLTYSVTGLPTVEEDTELVACITDYVNDLGASLDGVYSSGYYRYQFENGLDDLSNTFLLNVDSKYYSADSTDEDNDYYIHRDVYGYYVPLTKDASGSYTFKLPYSASYAVSAGTVKFNVSIRSIDETCSFAAVSKDIQVKQTITKASAVTIKPASKTVTLKKTSETGTEVNYGLSLKNVASATYTLRNAYVNGLANDFNDYFEIDENGKLTVKDAAVLTDAALAKNLTGYISVTTINQQDGSSQTSYIKITVKTK